MNRKRTVILKVLSVLLCALGSLPFLYFFVTVDQGTPLSVLIVGVAMISVSGLLSIITVEDNSYNFHFIFFLYFSSLMFFSMYRIRFDNLSSGDILFEYRTARNTLEQEVWWIRRSQWERFFSSISVSLTPALISEITGLDLLLLFKYGYRIVAAVLPIALYYLVNEVFKNAKISAIASVLFSQLYFNHIKLMNLTRQQISEIFFVLFLLAIFRIPFQRRRNYRSYFILMFTFMFSFVSSHYTINYFSIPILGAMFFTSLVGLSLPKKLVKRIRLEMDHFGRKVVSSKVLLLLLIFSLLWWSTFHFANFKSDISQEVENIFFKKVSESYSQVKWVRGSPLGPVITAWFNMVAALAAIGFIFALFRLRKDVKTVYWIAATSAMFAAMAFWLTPNQSMTGAYPDRIYIIGFIFFSSFIALVLYSSWKHRFLKIFFVMFILLNLSMNMFLLANSDYVHFNREENVPAEKAVIHETLRDAEFTLQVWMNEHVPTTETILTHFFGGINIFFLRHEVYLTNSSSTILLNETTYIVLDQNSLLFGMWRSGELDYEVINVTAILKESSIVYNNGRAALISSKESLHARD